MAPTEDVGVLFMNAFELLANNKFENLLEFLNDSLIEAIDAFYDDPVGYAGDSAHEIKHQYDRLKSLADDLDLNWTMILEETTTPYERERMQSHIAA